MTVEEFIDKLLKIQDKSKNVILTRDSVGEINITEYSKYVLLLDFEEE